MPFPCLPKRSTNDVSHFCWPSLFCHFLIHRWKDTKKIWFRSNVLKCHWLPLTPTLFHLHQKAAKRLESHCAPAADDNNSAPELPRSAGQRPFWTSLWSLRLDWKRIRCNLMGWWAVNIPEARTAVLPREQLWWMAGVTTETYGNSKACRDVTLWM